MTSEIKRLAASQIFKMTAGALAAMALAGAAAQSDAADLNCTKDSKNCIFNMVRPAALANNTACLPNAKGTVKVTSGKGIELMKVEVEGLKPNTEYDFFVIQVPAAPFGLTWYQGDIETDGNGKGKQFFAGRFNEETFIVAQSAATQPLTPQVHDEPPPAFRDAFFGETTQVGPIHTFHLGLWFNSPDDAAQVGCPGTVTPFNGEHNAGIQILNTSNFPDQQGPLINIKP